MPNDSTSRRVELAQGKTDGKRSARPDVSGQATGRNDSATGSSTHNGTPVRPGPAGRTLKENGWVPAGTWRC